MFTRSLALIAIVAAVPAVLAAILYDVTTTPMARPAEFQDRVLSFGEAPAGETIPIIARYQVGSNRCNELLYR